VLSKTTGGMPSEMFITFLVSLLSVGLLWLTLWKFELTAKNASMKLKRLRRRLEAQPTADSPQPAGAPVLTP
jgi:hypothetical protein